MWYIEIDFYLLKSLIKLFIKAGVLGDLGLTVDYPKKLVLDIILKSSGATKSAPVSRKRGLKSPGANRMGLHGLPGRLAAGAI